MTLDLILAQVLGSSTGYGFWSVAGNRTFGSDLVSTGGEEENLRFSGGPSALNIQPSSEEQDLRPC